jgi:hypothetical protein
MVLNRSLEFWKSDEPVIYMNIRFGIIYNDP